jgi:hypothetical protein
MSAAGSPTSNHCRMLPRFDARVADGIGEREESRVKEREEEGG